MRDMSSPAYNLYAAFAYLRYHNVSFLSPEVENVAFSILHITNGHQEGLFPTNVNKAHQIILQYK